MTCNFAMIIPSYKFLRKDLILSIKRIYILCATVALCIIWSRQDATYFCSNVSKAVNLEMDDPYLVEFIRMCRMQLPSNKKYKFRNTGMDNAKIVLNDYYLGYSHFWADAVFLSQSLVPKGKQTKRYFECGASDGEFMSQSYFSERFLDWSGILVEADQIYFNQMMETNRKSTKLQLCASKSTKSNVMSFLHTDKGKVNNKEYLYPGSGRIFEGEIPEIFEKQPNTLVDVFCAPVYTMLLATNALSLDVFYLDIEGAELEVLKSLPFHKIDIAIFVVEYNEDQEKFNDLKVFFEEKEYHLADYSIIDTLFIKNEYVENTKTNISGKAFYDEIKKWSELKPLKD